MPWEIYCHQMNFKFWNHNRFETCVIDFMGHGLSATFTMFPDTKIWYHGLLSQLNNHLCTTDETSLMLSQCMDVFSVHTHRLNMSIFTLSKIEKSYYWDMGMKRKTSMHIPSVKAIKSCRTVWRWLFNWAPSSEFVSSSIPSWQILTVHAQPFRGAKDLAFCLKVPLDSLLVWASCGGSGETARMRRLAWTFAARIGDKYQIHLRRSNWQRSLSYKFGMS